MIDKLLGRQLQWLLHIQSYLFPRLPQQNCTRARGLWLLLVYTFRRWWTTDRCGYMAASLSLQTIISVVPITGIALLILHEAAPDIVQTALHDVARSLSPHGQSQITNAIIALGSNVNIERLGIMGIVVTMVIAHALIMTLESVFNKIWRVEKRRNPIKTFALFYSVFTLIAVFMGYSFAQPFVKDLSSFLIQPSITTGLGFLLLYKVVPNHYVRWKAAIIPALIAAIAFELGKNAFGAYVSSISIHTYKGIYGSFALIPISVIWSQASWLIVLFGVELSYAIHNLEFVRSEGFVAPENRDSLPLQMTPNRIAARLLFTICYHYRCFQHGLSADQLNELYYLQPKMSRQLLTVLVKHGYLYQKRGDYLPHKALHSIHLQDIFALFGSGDVQRGSADVLTGLFQSLDEEMTKVMPSLSFSELVDQEIAARQT